jgi:peptidyl-prolyl cis-trans isomerase C
MRQRLRRWLRDPLMRFLIGGGLLSLALGGLGIKDPSRLIVVDDELTTSLAAEYAEEFLHTPDDAQMRHLVQEHIENEVLYREALRYGLEKDDPVIRKRLIQKMRLVLEGDNEPRPPDRTTLKAWHAAHAERYTIGEHLTFRVLTFSRVRDGIPTVERARNALAALQRQGAPIPASDPFLAGDRFSGKDASAIASVFGSDFSEALGQLPAGPWSGPVQSPYGHHLVQISSREPARLMTLEECETEVRSDWYREMQETRVASAMNRLVADYDVEDTP